MHAHSEDLGKKIVEALRRGKGNSQAARTFSASLSSVKRSAKTAEEGRSLAPPKRPSSKPSPTSGPEGCSQWISRSALSHTAAEVRVPADGEASVEVSRFTMCWSIKRMDATRKKGGRSAQERDESSRAAWRVMVVGMLDPGRPVFVDECGTHTSVAPLYGYCPKGERLKLPVARKTGARTDPVGEHHLGGDGAIPCGRGLGHQRSLRSLSCGAGPPSRSARRAGADHGEAAGSQAEQDEGADRAEGLRVVVLAQLLPGLQPHRRDVLHRLLSFSPLTNLGAVLPPGYRRGLFPVARHIAPLNHQLY